ncbi:uncharacterized protein N7473_013414 [Penicillium subrubescens]|uniref:Uncharacterized protein n=1 Tax=Penicillium subrubescens TaxID=1316194 RepID=A0A1Q5TE65_9EURO|nr:uncharacterized protein N7473_013414 [Penicillium subrubescens]KAJ5873541.1 hypothetical protein N7473_013414 [Penicillium subrubescens]OKO98514.1 hypothetical protein PENSUB_9190 [Penicillium subrubescens]
MASHTALELGTEGSNGSFLADLGPPIRRYPYRDIDQFLNTLKMELCCQQEDFVVSEWVLFTGVKQQTFRRTFLDSHEDDKILSRCWNSYDSSQYLLLVKMTVSRAHEVAAHEFERFLLRSLMPMGIDLALKTFGSASCVADNGSAKQPDCQFLPKRPPRARSKKWPSLVVEAGFSESPSKLMSDARFWLKESRGDVQMVITIKIGRSTPEIVLEMWELVDDRVKHTQVVTISKGENNRIYIPGPPLIIHFNKLFLRQSSIPKEADIIFDESVLEIIATNVWEEQGF